MKWEKLKARVQRKHLSRKQSARSAETKCQILPEPWDRGQRVTVAGNQGKLGEVSHVQVGQDADEDLEGEERKAQRRQSVEQGIVLI